MDESLPPEDAVTSAAALGAARGAAGFGIGTGLLELGEPDWVRASAYAEAWVDGFVGGLLDRGALDPDTGLASRDYLLTRLRDLARIGGAGQRRLVVAEAQGPASRFERMLLAARIGESLKLAFPEAELPTRLASLRVAAIVPRTPGLDAHAIACRRAVEAIAGVRAAGIRTVELPEAAEAVADFLREL